MAGPLNTKGALSSTQGLAILYDLALTIGSELVLTPLLTRFLQRLLYHTGFPVGLFFREIDRRCSSDCPKRRATLAVALGDFALSARQGDALDVPSELLERTSAVLSDPQTWAGLGLRTPRQRAIRLPVGEQGVIVLLGNPQREVEKIYTELFAPVLENLAHAIGFCQNYEQVYQSILASYSSSLSQQQLYSAVLANTHDGVLITDTDLRVVDCTAAFSEITGFSRHEVVGQKVPVSASGRHDAAFYQEVWREIERTGKWQGEIWNRRKNGKIELDLVRIGVVRDEASRVINYFAIYTNIHELKSFQTRLERLAHHDALTDLPNATYFTKQLEAAIPRARRVGKALAVIYIDLDNFGEINDQYGQATGDMLIVAAAQRLRERTVAGTLVARVGGDEFAVMLTDLADWHAAESHVDDLLNVFALPFEIQGQSLQIAASLGVTVFPDDDADAGGLLRHAQVSMHRAKDEARGRCRFFDADQNIAARRRRTMLGRIETALQKGDFRLFYQPKVDMSTGRLAGFEALLRWQDPDNGLIPPGDFLPEAEQHEIIISIGEWVMRDALRQAVVWQQGGLSTNISVNIAALHLQQPDFLQRVHAALACVPGAHPSHLGIEILESAALSNLRHVHSVIEEGKSSGLHFSLDDFGTGYSSLAYLRELPVNTLKIDQTFVRNLFRREGDAAIVQAVVGIAGVFGRQLVAEGVETVEHGMLLASMGCSYGQGYGISRPMPADAVANWVSNFQPAPEWVTWSNRHWDPSYLRHLGLRHDHHDWLSRLGNAVNRGDANLDGITHSPLQEWLAGVPNTGEAGRPLQALEHALSRLRREMKAADTAGATASLTEIRQASAQLITAFDKSILDGTA